MGGSEYRVPVGVVGELGMARPNIISLSLLLDLLLNENRMRELPTEV